MSMKPRVSEPASQRRSRSEPARRLVSNAREQLVVASGPHIVDAVRDQHGDPWISYGTPQRSVWFAVGDLISDAAAVFRLLSTVGAVFLTPASQSALKRKVECHTDFRTALVAARPGWLEGFYVFGDGSVARPRSDEREVIVVFERHPKFASRGGLAEWQQGVAPFVTQQPLLFFALGLALSGALRRFAPRGYLNPQAEIVGTPETGKSSVGVLAASVWAGNPESDCGGGESWDLTVNSLDPLKLVHNDGFLFLDEANLAGGSQKERRDFARQAVFKVAATGGRRRLGDAVQGEHARLAMLSTTNAALIDLVEGSTAERDAVQSRRLTIRVPSDAPHGVFDTLPEGYETARAASEAMVEVADRYWGVAGRAFIKRLVKAVEEDGDKLRSVIARGLANYMRRDRAEAGSARGQKTFALAAVALALAQRYTVLPKAWGEPFDLIQTVARSSYGVESSNRAAPLAAVQAYVEQHGADLKQVERLPRPLTQAEFEAAKGFLRQDDQGTEVLIPAARFQAAFPDHQAMMRELRSSGHARTEGGSKPKLTIKTPRSICSEGRVYCIRLDTRTG